MAIVPTCPVSGCGFVELMMLIHNLVQFTINIAIIAIGASVLYGGVLMITSAGDPGRWDKAREAVTAAVVGAVIIFSAWIVVNTIITFFTNCSGQWNVFGDFRCR